ncbi:Aste57867_20799 [Aphanomyces stellatus]|uniref:Aste57867_20799 protein n=1 Tax=Aphanomyces stellatus TaxID=120398 RepID=A0A485LKK2_9STRA|nr:hypothetical protein As57867_020731 [Aphanomyces stellatus]VFT97478.1 Aste57867_20799 [Aphanomyces stellatus]
MGMLDLDSEYALLRATSDRAWEIEKRLGMSITLVPNDRDPKDWRVDEISRNVATRIAHVATWMKDPKERSKRILAAEAKRMETLMEQEAAEHLPPRIAALAKPKRSELGTKVTKVTKSPPRPTPKRDDKADTANRKAWTRPKDTAPPPVDIAVPWESPRPKAKPLPSKTTQLLVSLNIDDNKVATATSPTHEHVASPPPTPTTSQPPEQAMISPAHDNPPLATAISAASHAKAHEFEMPKTPLGSESAAQFRPPPQPKPAVPPSSIGPQVLSSRRTMPSASFGYGPDMSMWSLPFLRRLFNDLDGDRDGMLTKMEVSVALHRVHVYVPPSRIAHFFNQVAALTQSGLSLIDFGQFTAFVLAARDAKYEPPTTSRRPPPPPPPPAQDAVAPLVLQDDMDHPPLHLEKILPEHVATRVMARLAATDERKLRPLSPELVRQVTRDLLVQHLGKSIEDESGIGGMGVQLDAPTPTTVVDESPWPGEVELLMLVKAFLLQHLQETTVDSEPVVLEPPVQEVEEVVVEQSPTIACSVIQESQAPLPPMEPVEPTKAVTTAEQATDTIDLEPNEVAHEALPTKLNVADLPGKTLLGKLLHCDSLADGKVHVEQVVSTSLVTTLRRMRTRRLNDAAMNKKRALSPPPPPPPPAPPVSPTFARKQGPPPPPPGSPPSFTNRYSKPQPSIGSTTAMASEPPLTTHLYNLAPPPRHPADTLYASVVSSKSSSDVALSSYEPSLDKDDLLSEGEILDPDTFSDGEVEGPSRHTFYHLHRLAFQKEANMVASTSMEEGELETLFVATESVSSSTGSIESGQVVDDT